MQGRLGEIRPAKETMTGVHQLEQNRQVYSVEGADAVIHSARPNSPEDLSSGPPARQYEHQSWNFDNHSSIDLGPS